MTELPKLRWQQVLPWLLGGVLVAYFYAYFAAMTSGDVDLTECHELESAVVAENFIPPAVSSPGHPGIFCDREIRLPFLTHHKKVYVYGVTDTAAQNSVAQTLQKVNGERRGGKILLQFFDKENWTTWSDPATGRNGGRRGRETPLQSIWIN